MKPGKKPADARLELRLPASDKEAFEEYAIEQGFRSTSQWLLWLARRAIKDSRSRE